MNAINTVVDLLVPD